LFGVTRTVSSHFNAGVGAMRKSYVSRCIDYMQDVYDMSQIEAVEFGEAFSWRIESIIVALSSAAYN